MIPTMKRRIGILTLVWMTFCLSMPAFAQDKAAGDSLGVEYTTEYLDTVNIKKVFKMNNYSMLGFEYGASLNMGRFSPSYNHKMLFQPIHAGVTFTHYQKNYNGSPNFGYEFGIFYGKQGYALEKNSGLLVEKASRITVDYLQVPLWMVMHFDAPHIKAMVNLGPYGGYRLTVNRSNEYDTEIEVNYPDSFAPADSRFDYGLSGGAGFGFVIDPVELHVYLRTSFSFSSFFHPEAYITETSKNMLYIYPWDVSLTLALQFQTSRRSGKTNSQLRHEAKDRVMSSLEKQTE